MDAGCQPMEVRSYPNSQALKQIEAMGETSVYVDPIRTTYILINLKCSIKGSKAKIEYQVLINSTAFYFSLDTEHPLLAPYLQCG